MRKTVFVFVATVVLMFLLPVVGCMASGRQRVPETISLNYPVVLVHGIAAHDRGEYIKSWGRIPETLKENGIMVFFGNTDAWGSIESNANILKETIEQILYETGSERVNIIAHSKGGIDSRYLIWAYNFGDRVASLTTIATPHRGAEVADLIYAIDLIRSDFVQGVLRVFGQVYGDINPNMPIVNYQLTTEYMRGFNERVLLDDRVFFQSVYSVMYRPLDDIFYYCSYRHIYEVSGPNDGLVSEWSANWGDNVIRIDVALSHSEIIDRRRGDTDIDVPSLYLQLVSDLAQRGF
jgi:triacylglycerol lipase